jgi:hypothetical protein
MAASNVAWVPQTTANGIGSGNNLGNDVFIHGNSTIYPTQSSTFYQNQF